LENGVEVNIRN